MSAFETALVLVFCVSTAGTLVVFALYPAALYCARGRPPGPSWPPGWAPGVSVLVAVRNAEELVEAKVRNCLGLSCPGPLEVAFVSDGSTDRTVERLREVGAGRVRVLVLAEHEGKAAALDEAVAATSGELLVFSDADALLAEDALSHLLRPFADPEVGGVCGQRVILERGGDLTEAQRGYVAADSAIKRGEARLGSVTSNDGKLYAIRRSLYRPIAPGATDDLFTCLSVVEQGRRFVFEPRARAFIRTPSRGTAHELARRRRIVARSLHGIALKRQLLNPLRHGSFAVQLLVNKVLRRMLPLFVAGVALSALLLASGHSWARLVLVAVIAFFTLAAARQRLASFHLLGRASALAHYFCVGNLGTLLGLMDFARGRVAVKWDPVKSG